MPTLNITFPDERGIQVYFFCGGFQSVSGRIIPGEFHLTTK
ncbi:MAG: hypothetical protein AAB401_18115 [Acidobacteriota bacterium]